MAKAEKKVETKIEMVKVEKKETTVVLTLTEAEARTLASVMANIAGSEYNSARKYTSQILHALSLAGYCYSRCLPSYKFTTAGMEFLAGSDKTVENG